MMQWQRGIENKCYKRESNEYGAVNNDNVAKLMNVNEWDALV